MLPNNLLHIIIQCLQLFALLVYDRLQPTLILFRFIILSLLRQFLLEILNHPRLIGRVFIDDMPLFL
jgi:hypothetical protein